MIYECHVEDDLVFSENERPRYLLPEGCKDLNDVIRLQEREAAMADALKSMPASRFLTQ